MTETGTTRNPHHLCTLGDSNRCTTCGIEGGLNCRFSWGDLLYFFVLFAPPAITAVAGMVLGGYGPWLLAWAGYMIFFFFVWEARVLCSHCPFWAEDTRVLHCLANHGVIKLWRYRPGPMSRSEGVQFLVGAGVLILFPFPFMLLGSQYVLALATLAGMTAFAFSLVKNICPRCINFSCPLNGVPKATVDAYLRQNPVMRRAWEESGYQLDPVGDIPVSIAGSDGAVQ